MSWFGDAIDFERYNIGQAWDKLMEHPERAFLGALDPFSSKVWGTVLGQDYEPLMSQTGAPTEDTYRGAEERGINTGAGRAGHTVASTIASFFGGGAAANGFKNAGLLGNTAASSGAGSGALQEGGSGAFLGEGAQSGVPAWDSAASPGMWDRFKTGAETFNKYAKPIGQAYQTAGQTGLLGGQQQPIQPSPMAQPMPGANQTLASVAQMPSANMQQMQLAEQMRQRRRSGLLGGA